MPAGRRLAYDGRMPPRGAARAVVCAALWAIAAAPAPAAAGDGDGRSYGGVVPGYAGDGDPPAAGGAWTSISWLGFVPEEEARARIFVQLGRGVSPRQEIVDGELWVLLDRVRLGPRVRGRPLDVRFFDTDLEAVRAERVSRRPAREDAPALPDGAKINVSFQDDAEARQADVSIVREEDGYYYLFLDFGPRP